jgi:hypothetical protein
MPPGPPRSLPQLEQIVSVLVLRVSQCVNGHNIKGNQHASQTHAYAHARQQRMLSALCRCHRPTRTLR